MEDLQAFGVEAGKGRYHEEAFYGVVLVYTALFDKIAKCLDAYGLTPAKMNVLMVIKHQGIEKGLSQREIGKRLMVTPSNMTRLLEKLVREKLVERSGLEGDRRVKVIRVSKKGSLLLDKAWPEYIRVMKRETDKLSSSEQKALAGLLMKWFRGIRSGS